MRITDGFGTIFGVISCYLKPRTSFRSVSGLLEVVNVFTEGSNYFLLALVQKLPALT